MIGMLIRFETALSALAFNNNVDAYRLLLPELFERFG